MKLTLKEKATLAGWLLGSSLSAPVVALAAVIPDPAADKFKKVGNIAVPITGGNGPVGDEEFGELVISVVNLALLAIGSVAVIFLVLGAYRYIVARGNEEQMESAKKTMTGAIIGLVIVVLAFAIVAIITNVLVEGTGGLGV